MDNQERLINGVLNGDVSVIDDVMSERFDVSFDGQEALRAAKMKLFEAKTKVLSAESIVGMLEIGGASNERIPEKHCNDNHVPLFNLIQSMSQGSVEAKKILAEIAKAGSNKTRFILDMKRLGMTADDIVAAYEFCKFDIEELFDLLDYDMPKLIGHLADFNEKEGA